ncbi:MAG: DUF494 domain-containing protein [Nitrococcus mobilis]|nr:DUF494 domain-containing protein [Nitrococcus mobilis]
MKENVFDVLMYLFENDLYNEEELGPDREFIETELFEAGFSQLKIRKAFDWLDALADGRNVPVLEPGSKRSIRLFTEPELTKLAADCRGFLLYLEQVGILSSVSRELVIDRMMALDDEIDLDTLKWVVLMVLFSQPGHEEAYAWMENLIFDNPAHFLH